MLQVLIIFLSAYHCQSLVVPEELPSLLSLVYSNIPQIKKGHDSRFGFGFNLGRHADFQMLIELGPQNRTRPIGGKTNSDSDITRKRNADDNDYLSPKNSSQKIDKHQKASDWLKQWQKNAKKNPNSNKQMEKIKNDKISNIKMVPILNESALSELMSLYKAKDVNDESSGRKSKSLNLTIKDNDSKEQKSLNSNKNNNER